MKQRERLRRRVFWNGLTMMIFCGVSAFLAYGVYNWVNIAPCPPPPGACVRFVSIALFGDLTIVLVSLAVAGLIIAIVGARLPRKRGETRE